MSRRLVALLAPAFVIGVAQASAADLPRTAGASPAGPSGRLVPEQFSTAADRVGNPLEFGYYLQDLLTRAEVATKQKDQARVIKYYRAVAAAIPEEARGWGLLCEAYQTAGDRERAVRACKYAIDRQGAQLQDYRRYVELLAAKPGDLVPEERDELTAVLAHMDAQPDLALPTAHMRCEAAVKMKDRVALEACTAVLAKLAPADPKTIVFQWSLAVMGGDRSLAARLIDKAQRAGVSLAGLDRMSQVEPSRSLWSSRGLGAVAIAGGATLLLALFLLVVYRRRSALRRLAP
jgi:tetratricopeptide (TPR) repeat protein